MITLEQAKTLKKGDVLHHARLRYTSPPPGKDTREPITCKVVSVRTWKDGNYRIEAGYTPLVRFFIGNWDDASLVSPSDWCLTPEECRT